MHPRPPPQAPPPSRRHYGAVLIRHLFPGEAHQAQRCISTHESCSHPAGSGPKRVALQSGQGRVGSATTQCSLFNFHIVCAFGRLGTFTCGAPPSNKIRASPRTTMGIGGRKHASHCWGGGAALGSHGRFAKRCNGWSANPNAPPQDAHTAHTTHTAHTIRVGKFVYNVCADHTCV